MAMSKVHVPYRQNAEGEPASVAIPDHIDILSELANGAQLHMRASETTGLSTRTRAIEPHVVLRQQSCGIESTEFLEVVEAGAER